MRTCRIGGWWLSASISSATIVEKIGALNLNLAQLPVSSRSRDRSCNSSTLPVLCQ